MNIFIKKLLPRKTRQKLQDLSDWKDRAYAAPSPHFIKQACLLRNGITAATWVETGTYLGLTTELLSKHAQKVYSIEPEPSLFANAENKFRNHPNVSLLRGTSEDVFPTLLPKLHGPINFWLDGHYSGGTTFQGAQDTPIIEELNCIGKHLSHLEKVVILVDDIRCFEPPSNGKPSAYPPLDFLVAWAKENGFTWHIEHDIFIAKR